MRWTLATIIYLVILDSCLKCLAYCFETVSNNAAFPLPPPHQYIPWIWDASIHDSQHLVEVTTISQSACVFDRAIWKALLNMYPQFSSQLASGNSENILVNATLPIFQAQNGRPPPHHLINKHVECQFMDSNYNSLGSSESLLIEGKNAAKFSTIQIRCPIPKKDMRFTYIRLNMIDYKYAYNTSYENELKAYYIRENRTASFPVCDLGKLYSKLKMSKRKFKLSICTATMRHDRSYLVEWLEFHRLMGVQHFFIYDTSPRKKQHLLRKVLADYVASGNITIVSWPYSNCVEGMGSGRWVQWVENKASVFFQPPRTISHTAALASCYSRFKFTTEWMAHVDDDEFLSFKSKNDFWGRRMTSLYDLVSAISTKLPHTSALYFRPIIITHCPNNTNRHRAHPAVRDRKSEVLPRFGRWQAARLGPEWEGKLIMRTDAVGMYNVHYVTLMEKGAWNPNPLAMPLEAAAMLHYKLAPESSGSIYGASLPFRLGALPHDCKLFPDRNSTLVRRRLSNFIIPLLEREYARRMGLTSLKAGE